MENVSEIIEFKSVSPNKVLALIVSKPPKPTAALEKFSVEQTIFSSCYLVKELLSALHEPSRRYELERKINFN